MAIELKEVESSNLRAIGYDPATRVLHVRFKNGSLYEYTNVPQTIFEGLSQAQSKGAFLNQNVVKNKEFGYRKLEPVPVPRAEAVEEHGKVDEVKPA